MSKFKDFTTLISYIAAALLLIFLLALFSLEMNRFFSPKQEQVRRDTYEQSSSYNLGMKRDLEEIQRQYIESTPAGKEALRSIALHRFSVYPVESMTPDQRSFYYQLKSAQ
jgi:hypothetical protein